MKIVITTQVVDRTHPILGFFHRWLLEFAHHYSEVHVICLEEGQHDLPEHVHVYSLGKERGVAKIQYLWHFYRYFKILYAKKPDMVFFHMGAIMTVLAAPFYIARFGQKTRFVWWKTHGQINWLGRLALLFVDRVCTAAPKSFPIATKKVRSIGHAIDTSLFAPSGIAPSDPILLFTGRIMPVKHVDDVLEVTKELKHAGIKIQTRIVGAVADEIYLEELKEQCVRTGITGVVTFVPPVTQSELVKEYQNARVVINPSRHDGLDKVVLEAMATGTPVVTGNRAFTDMLSPHGLAVPQGDISAYVSAVQPLLQMSSETRKSFGLQLRNIVITDHAITTLVERINNAVKI